MTTLTAYKSPPFAFGWIPEAVNLIAPGIAPPSGVYTAFSNMLADWSNAQTDAIGSTHKIVNPGQPNTGTTFGQRAMLDKGDALYGLLGGASWASANQNTCRAAANQINPFGQKAFFYMTEFGEKLVEFGVDFVAWNGSQQKEWVDLEMESLVQGAGGHFYGDYDGHLDSYTPFYADRNSVRTALASNSGALTYALAHSGFGNPYYTGNDGAFRDGVLKMYLRGADSMNLYVAVNLANMLIDKKARAQRGYTTRVACMFWPGFDERTGKAYTGQRWSRKTPQGGTLTRSTPPYASFSAQIFAMAMCQLLGFDTYAWTEPELFGSNPAISIGTGMAGGVEESGDVGQKHASVYEPGDLPAGYPYSPKGSYDIVWAATHLAYYVHHHAGIATWAYAAIKINGGTTSGTASSYVVDQYEGQKVTGFIFSSGTARSYISFDGNESGIDRTVTVAIPGGADYAYRSFGMSYHVQNFTV